MIIDRSKWFYGKVFNRLAITNLYHGRANKYCCLGFLGKSLGYTEDNMHNQPMPSYLINGGVDDMWPSTLLEECPYDDGRFAFVAWEDVLAEINDCETADNADREAWLITGFKTLFNIDVEFVGNYPWLP